MTLVQVSPTEIRSLDLNAFRLDLKALEDGNQGMTYPVTHVHNPPLTVGGVELARTVEIINDYTVTFEDGQYAVNLVGANSNVGDRVNVNQVSVRSANSAGLVTSAAIEYGEYGGGVTIDEANITGNAKAGSVYPTGTLRQPCLFIPDALILAEARGFQRLFILGNACFTAAHDVDGLIILGTSHVQNDVTLEDGASCTNSVFRELEIFGILDGNNEIDRCIVNDLLYFSGHIHTSGLQGEVVLAGGTASVLSDCKTVDPYSPPSINMGGSGQDLAMPNFSGILTVTNMDGSNFAGIGLLGGTVVLADTVVAGTVQCAGVGALVDSGGEPIPSGNWNGGVTIINQTVTEESIAGKILDHTLTPHTTPDTVGKALLDIDARTTRIAGMVYENSMLEPITTDSNEPPRMTSGRLRCYDSKTNADAAYANPSPGTDGLLFTYLISASYTGTNQNPDKYAMTLEV